MRRVVRSGSVYFHQSLDGVLGREAFEQIHQLSLGPELPNAVELGLRADGYGHTLETLRTDPCRDIHVAPPYEECIQHVTPSCR